MATLNELVVKIESYFVHTQEQKPDPFASLPKEEYHRYLALVDSAIELAPDEPFLWFRRGWGLQFFGEAPTLLRHPQFEHIEQAYERVLELDPGNAPASLMLTHLHWDDARRAIAEREFDPIRRQLVVLSESEYSFESLSPLLKKLEAILSNLNSYYTQADYTRARELWNSTKPHMSSLDWARATFGETVCPYFRDPRYFIISGASDRPIWMEIIEQMGLDLMGGEAWGLYHYELYFHLLDEHFWFQTPLELIPVLKQAATFSKEDFIRAESYMYLGQSFTEANGQDPEEGLNAFDNCLKILAGATEPEHRRRLNFSGLSFWDTRLKNFFVASPQYRKQHPARCLDLAERFITATDGFEYLRYQGGLEPYLGEFCIRLGRYQEAVEYLERARRDEGLDDESLEYLVVAYTCVRRYDEAASAFSAIKEPGEAFEFVLPIIYHAKSTKGEQEQLLEVFSKRLGRIEEQGNLIYQFLQDLGETLMADLMTIRQELPKAESGRLDEEFAGRLADEVAARVADRLDPDERYYQQAEDECRQTWFEYWSSIPDDLKSLIVHSEILYRVCEKQRKSADWSIVVVQLGKIAEIAFKQSLIVPLADYLEEKRFSSLPSQNKQGRNEQLERKGKSSWRDTLEQAPMSHLIGLLEAARDNESHPVNIFLRERNYKVWNWLDSIPEGMQRVTDRRNKAAHEAGKFNKRDAGEVRSLLTAGGLLAMMLEELRPQGRRPHA